MIDLGPPPAPPGYQEPERAPRPAPHGATSAWLVRHPQVALAERGLAYGDRDVALAPEGLEDCAALATLFGDARPARIVHSDLERAARLALAIADASELEARADRRLRELHRGDWQDLPRAEYRARWRDDAKAWWGDPWRWKGHGGESEEELCARTWPAFEDALDGVDRLLVVAHRNVVRSLVAAALGLPPAASLGLVLDPGRGCLLVGSGGVWHLARSNERPIGADAWGTAPARL